QACNKSGRAPEEAVRLKLFLPNSADFNESFNALCELPKDSVDPRQYDLGCRRGAVNRRLLAQGQSPRNGRGPTDLRSTWKSLALPMATTWQRQQQPDFVGPFRVLWH